MLFKLFLDRVFILNAISFLAFLEFFLEASFKLFEEPIRLLGVVLDSLLLSFRVLDLFNIIKAHSHSFEKATLLRLLLASYSSPQSPHNPC